MKALVKRDFQVGLTLMEVDMPYVNDNELLIRVLQTGICGTDIHIYKSDQWTKKNVPVPMVVGHEFVGEVVEIGRLVSHYRVGEIVSAEGHIVCGVCEQCRTGMAHCCARMKGIGIQRLGAFAEYVAVPQQNIWRHASSTPSAMRVLFDPLGNAVHSALAFDLLGKRVLITGAGPIGLMATAVAKHMGALEVVVSDLSEYRLKLAQRMGATTTLHAKTSTIAKNIRDLVGEQDGFDVGLEMSGNAAAFSMMIASLKNGGKLAMLGLFSQDITTNLNDIVLKYITLQGIYGRRMFVDWYAMDSMIASGLDLSPVITHTMSYTAYETAFQKAMGGQAGKVVLNWN